MNPIEIQIIISVASIAVGIAVRILAGYLRKGR